MKLKNIAISTLIACLGIWACDEEALSPNPPSEGITFAFPEGSNAWDQELQAIAQRFNTKCIYKNITTENLTRSWVSNTGLGTAEATYHGTGLVSDEQARLYTQFFAEHVFAFLNPEVVNEVLPPYILFAHDYCSINHRQLMAGEVIGDLTEGDSLEWCGSPRMQYNGLGFWAFSLSSEEHLDIWGTPWQQYMFKSADSVKMYRELILKNIFNTMVEEGVMVPPLQFEEGGLFDYTTPITWMANTVDDENYYKRRGFPEQLRNMSTPNSRPTDLYNVILTDPAQNFTDYLWLAFRYSADEIRENYADFPLVIQAYDIVVAHVRNTYGMDISKIGERPEQGLK